MAQVPPSKLLSLFTVPSPGGDLLAVANKTTVQVLELKSGKIHELKFPSTETLESVDGDSSDEEEAQPDAKGKRKTPSKDPDAQGFTVSLSFDSTGKYLFQASDDKIIRIFRMSDFTCVAQKRVIKKVSRSLFSDNDTRVIVADKFGEVYSLSVPELRDRKNLLGHLSIITDMQLLASPSSSSRSFLATADVDEKVRISRWPDTFVIQSFCLGYSSFITAVSFVADPAHPQTPILATGGDGAEVRLWDPLNGHQLAALPLLSPQEAALIATPATIEPIPPPNAKVQPRLRNRIPRVVEPPGSMKWMSPFILALISHPSHRDLIAVSHSRASEVLILRVEQQGRAMQVVARHDTASSPVSLHFTSSGQLWATSHAPQTVQCFDLHVDATSHSVNLKPAQQAALEPLNKALGAETVYLSWQEEAARRKHELKTRSAVLAVALKERDENRKVAKKRARVNKKEKKQQQKKEAAAAASSATGGDAAPAAAASST